MNQELLLMILLAVSEALALIPALKSNGILDLARNVLKALLPLAKQKPEEKPEEPKKD